MIDILHHEQAGDDWLVTPARFYTERRKWSGRMSHVAPRMLCSMADSAVIAEETWRWAKPCGLGPMAQATSLRSRSRGVFFEPGDEMQLAFEKRFQHSGVQINSWQIAINVQASLLPQRFPFQTA